MRLPGKLVPEALKTLGKDSATIRYPEQSRSMPDRFRGRVAFDPDGCTGCGMCERHCAADAIVVEADGSEISWRYDESACMFCGQCGESCPTDVITMSEEYDLASSDPASFETTHTFER
ncbi:4Fe-4S dicluster domain-containing protein [Halapricum hydrolyticum]|uniref:4Fe-4S binding protein n=1 Tax=Halapricum hydrolyticum TaxID=2979991 RepID=A0AAE3IAR0_9EURY|nr:4Fe-4S dicluster domain-containing protein [Halapricum hydrolyticum]MCU4717493.1 4Fe-4S binding protein [Halapricum hydrolyticum]MCU4726657.1 4Fe-4S binding protein [Halapricum hydrolyticum]